MPRSTATHEKLKVTRAHHFISYRPPRVLSVRIWRLTFIYATGKYTQYALNIYRCIYRTKRSVNCVVI